VTVAGQSRHVIRYMKDFLFRPEQARTPVGVLSGGERARLTLARAFARPSNLLVLDEPTNDLDLETLDLLQERLAEYPGHGAAGQPRPRLPRSGGDFSHRDRRRRAVDRVCRRLHRYAGTARTGRPRNGASKSFRNEGPRPLTEVRARPAARLRRMSFNDRRALEILPPHCIGSVCARSGTI